MFAENACYHSPNVGVFNGRNAIGEMMAGFFTQYPDVHWKAKNYRLDDDFSVLFEFRMTATQVKTGEEIYREGVEQIDFTDQGLISRLEVKSK